MQQLLDFSSHHWQLCLAFVVILILLILFEQRNRLTGFRGLSPQETILLINRDQGVVLDIRSSDAFVKGHIVSSINIIESDLSNQLTRLEKYKDKIIVIVPNGAQVPGKANALLQRSGFKQINYLTGGIANWQSASLPLVKGK